MAHVRLLAVAVLCPAASPIWGMEVQRPSPSNCQPVVLGVERRLQMHEHILSSLFVLSKHIAPLSLL